MPEETSMHALRSLVVAGFILTTAAPSARGQQPQATSVARIARVDTSGAGEDGLGALRGSVHFAGDSGALYGVEISIEGTILSSHSAADGAIRINAIPPGRYSVLARRFGFVPARASVDVVAGGVYDLDVALAALPVALARVTIRGESRVVPPYLEDAYRRGASGHGTFLTAEDIDRMHPMDVQSVIASVPGAHVNQAGISFARCGYGLDFSFGARLQIYIDGTRVTYGTPESTDLALKTIHVAQIQAMEVYRGVSQIPAEFLADACAVIAIWTKRGGR
jgi:hypothetical protein